MTPSAVVTPSHWTVATLGEVAQWGSGGTPRATNRAFYGGVIPWAVIGDLNDGIVADTASSITEEALRASSTRLVEAGSILVAMYGSIGKLGIAGRVMATNQAIAFAKPRPGVVEGKYLYWWLRCQRSALLHAGKGATQQNISQQILKAWPIPLPPLEEQHQIVFAIEEHLSRVERSYTLIDGARRRTLQYRNRVLQLAISGRLDPHESVIPIDSPSNGTCAESDHSERLPLGWTWRALGDLAKVTSGSTPKAGDPRYYAGGRIPWVTSGDLNERFVREPRQFVTEQAVRDYRLKVLPPGTLLVAMYGEGKTRGKCSELAFPATTNQACAALIFADDTSAYRPWVKLFLDASYEANRRLASGGVQPNLSGGLIKSIEIPTPPLALQPVIVAEVDRQLAAEDRLVKACDRALARSGVLRSSILQAAFAGRLVDSRVPHETVPVLPGVAR